MKRAIALALFASAIATPIVRAQLLGPKLEAKPSIAPAIPGVTKAGEPVALIQDGLPGADGIVSLRDGTPVFIEQNSPRIRKINPDDTIATLVEETATARALGVDEHAVVKTLVMQDDAGDPLIVLMHGDCLVSTKNLARQIDRDLRPRSRPIKDATVDYTEFLARNRRTVRNVVGVMTGSDPARAREAVVIGAHYDHVGLGGRLSMTPERAGEIHNGADDNASGTASVIEIARAAIADRARFPRTLIFVTFAGEERGLLGSAHYVRSPAPVAIGSTVAMLNLDMVGRSRGAVDVSGLDRAILKDDLMASSQVVGGLEIKQEGPGAGRSDDSSFIDAHVPAINFFTGFHADYHRPTDDWQKIERVGTARVAALALAAPAVVIGDTAPAEAPLVMGWVHDAGEQMFVAGF